MIYKIKSAQLHNPVDIKGFVTKKTINSLDMQGCKLEYDGANLYVTFRNSKVVVPSHNILAVVVYDEPASK